MMSRSRARAVVASGVGSGDEELRGNRDAMAMSA
jgi:hypothetical protein